jgi:hypothetical protein
MSPRKLWEELGGAIIADGKEVQCEHLMTWLRVSATQQKNPVHARTPLPPANFLGATASVFPPLDEDAALQSHRWMILCQDLPALDTTTNRTAAEHMTQLVGAIRTDRAAERANDEARRYHETRPKVPSETKFKHAVLDWMRFSSITDEEDLPPVYKELANTDKGEHISILQAHLKIQARQVGAATQQTPVASKELLEMVKQARFYCEPHELNDLTLGLQPFAVGLFVGDKLSKTAEARAAGYENMLQGTVNPTLAEQATFTTKEVRIPQDLFSAKMMLCTLSIILDVLQGPSAPLARSYRNFCTHTWETIATKLHIQSQHNPALLTQVLPGILRWLQLYILNCIRVLMEGTPEAPLPDFTLLANVVLMEQWHQLPHLPTEYQVPVKPAAKSPVLEPRLLKPPPTPVERPPGEKSSRSTAM